MGGYGIDRRGRSVWNLGVLSKAFGESDIHGCMRDGRCFAVPKCRRLSWDLLWFHRSVPLCAHDLRMQLGAVAAARRLSGRRISWPAIFLKALGLAGREYPELRQTWFRWPWAYLYQHPSSVAMLTIQRELEGERWLFWGRLVEPERQGLWAIQEQLDHYQQGEVRAVFGRALQLAGLPFLLRRLVWWWNLNISARGRARWLGTCFLSTLSGRGVEIQLPPSIHTACLTYGPVDEDGECRVTLAYDHRVMDGMRAAEVLLRLEQILVEVIVGELGAI